MSEEYIPSSHEIKSKHFRNAMIIGFIALTCCVFIYYIISSESTDQFTKDNIQTASFSSPMDQVNTQTVWTERIQNKVKEQEQKTADLVHEVKQLRIKDDQKIIESDPRFIALQKQNQLMQEALNNLNQGQLVDNHSYQRKVESTVSSQSIKSESIKQSEGIGIDNDELNLRSASNRPFKNPDTYVPAGTHAESVVLGAADASAGVQSQANPSPTLIRIVADGTLPNGYKSHLKGCIATVAVVGDISSERGEMRLERMSCVFPNGEIVEQVVDGTVFGKDGKNGVRGNPVWREKALLARAAAAGTLSGLGNALSQTYTTNSISPLGATQTVNPGNVFKYGAAQGVSNAMEKLAEYNIKRADQYHPVIQLTAGQTVDIVFLKGFFLDGRSVKDTPKNHESNDLFPSREHMTSTGLTLSERELKNIERNETEMKWIK